MKKELKIGLIIALALSNLCTMATMVVIPIASNLYATYPESIVNYILSGSTLISAFAALVAAPIINKMGSKRFTILMLAVSTIAGVLSPVIDNAFFLAAMQSIVGLTIGGLCVSNNVLIAENYEDPNLRGTVLAIYRATQGLAAILLSTVAGTLAANDWRNAFKAFLLCLPALILVFFVLPHGAKKKAEQSSTASSEAVPKEKLDVKAIIPLNLSMVVFVLCYSLVYYQIGVIVVEKGVTNTTLIGALSSIGMVGGILGSVVFGFFAKKIKLYMTFVCFMIMAAMFVLLYFTDSPAGIAVSTIFIGLAYNLNLTYMYNRATIVVPPAQVGSSISIMTFLQSVFAFLSTYFASAIKRGMGVDTVVPTVIVIAIVLFAAGVCCLFYAVKNKDKVA